MDKESIYELQKIDCNCNDCKFMWRDFDRFKQALELHRTFQFSAFELKKKKIIINSEELARKGKYAEAEVLMKEVNKMKLGKIQNVAGKIQYGNCEKLKKDVSFIPNTCQLETQDCFEHRKENSQP